MTIKGLYAITPTTLDSTWLLEAVHAALEGGAGAIQYRGKGLDADLAREQAGRLRTVCRSFGRPLIVNDSVELAREVQADGVHLGRDDGSPALARERLGRWSIVGLSCYDDFERARQFHHQVDYCAFGSVFASSVKPGAVRAPLALVTQAAALGIQVCAIGGIDAGNAPSVVRAGAHAIAVITAVFGDGSTAPDVVRRNAGALAAAFSQQT